MRTRDLLLTRIGAVVALTVYFCLLSGWADERVVHEVEGSSTLLLTAKGKRPNEHGIRRAPGPLVFSSLPPPHLP